MDRSTASRAAPPKERESVPEPTTMTMERWIIFQAAHHLPRMPDGHKCRRVHGHTYRLTIACRGLVRDDGIIFDNAMIDDVLVGIQAQLDHDSLNDLALPFSDNPTAERILQWVWELAARVLGDMLFRVELLEGERSRFVMERRVSP